MNIKRIAAAVLLLTVAAAAGGAEIRGAWTADASDKGTGTADFQFSRKGSNNGRTMPLASFSGLSNAQVRSASQVPVKFTLPSEAGTVNLEGTFKDGFGAGQFSFSPNPAFLDTVRSMGVSTEPDKRRGRERDQDERLLQYALIDLSTTFIRSMQAAGYNVSLDRYLTFRIFSITPAYIREMRDLGYNDIPAKKLLSMGVHHVTPEFVRDLKAAGYSGIPLDKLIAMRIHGVDAEFARKMNGTN